MIVHISLTPLVASPGKLARLTNDYLGINSVHYAESDYPNALKNIFLKDTMVLNNDYIWDLLKYDLNNASIVHIHNEVSKKMIDFICSNVKSDCQFIYQTHSPLREGPNFVDISEYLGIHFSKKLVIAQYHPRLYPDFEPVPNFVDFDSSISLLGEQEVPKVLFCPAHNRTGQRWNDKVSPVLQEVIAYFSKFGKIELVKPSNMHPYTLQMLRKKCHITIDEIVTGSFHQVSLEGLASGNVVINNADYFSEYYLSAMSSKKLNDIPFYKMNERNAAEKFEILINDRDMIKEIQLKSKKFHDDYLVRDKVAEHYRGIYDVA